APSGLPRQVLVSEMSDADREEIRPQVEDYCKFFGGNAEEILNERFYVLTANPEAGYKQLYTFE
ncbi:MAG: glutamate synthase, partial [Butyricicoccus sp.]